MGLEPLQQWICDTCGELIERPKDGYVQWLVKENADEKIVKYAFHIVHHAPASPRRTASGTRGDDCYHRDTREVHIGDLPVELLIGADGLGHLLTLPYGGHAIEDMEELFAIIRRLHIPYFEEARLHFDKAIRDGIIESERRAHAYEQDTLLGILDRYAPVEEDTEADAEDDTSSTT